MLDTAKEQISANLRARQEAIQPQVKSWPAFAIRCGAPAERLSTQLSIHPSHAEGFIKVAAHDYHAICAMPPSPGELPPPPGPPGRAG